MKNNFQKKDRKAFTIVELVIVIAVIAILAAVLIPTFSNIIKKSNLSADMQACREMNMALKEEESTAGYVKPTSIETVMRILANHGYDAKNWQPLSADYKFLWDSELNQLVLVLKEDGTIVYPDADKYAKKEISAVTYGAGDRFQEYNQNVIAALNYTSFSFSSTNNVDTNKVTLSESSSGHTIGQTALASALYGNSESATKIKSATGVSGSTAYVAASTVTQSSNGQTYASCESMYLTGDENFVLTSDLISTGDYEPNCYVVSVSYGENATDEEKFAAEKAAGEYVYSLFVQMNSATIDNDKTIIIPSGTTINCSAHEWRATKLFTGYFGCPDGEVVIDGMKLSEDTGYAETYTLAGSGSQYYVTGFIGAVYGKATVENLTFRNVSIDSPGNNYVVASEKANRNTVAIIGAIIPNPLAESHDEEVDVTIKNIIVEETCSINGVASVGGIVGYIGSEYGYALEKGTILIDSCRFSGTVTSSDSRYIADDYSPVGGIIAFDCRCSSDLTITVKNCTFDGTASGYGSVGGIIGNYKHGNDPTKVNSNGDPLLEILNCTVTGNCTNLGNCTYPYKKNGTTPTNYDNYGHLGKLIGRDHDGKVSNAVNRQCKIDQDTVTKSSLTVENATGLTNTTIDGLG